ncbi:uncharacterized protein LOC135387724 [Ornithodoros turicata]|uniref:uncharacterized protein LOC135387724 n=1 Tax=Ornithodoros turicata TaxID=34597 RepID=UPI0031396D5F
MVAETLVNEWVSRFGAPLQLHSDQGRNFESQVFQGMSRCLGITKTRTTPLHPQSDGMVERFNRTILQHLSLFVADNHRNWDDLIPLFLLSYRTAVHEATQETPAMLLTGRELRLPSDLVFGPTPDSEAASSTSTYLRTLRSRLDIVHKFARDRMRQAFTRMKTRYDPVVVHTTVWRRTEALPTTNTLGMSHRLLRGRRGSSVAEPKTMTAVQTDT